MQLPHPSLVLNPRAPSAKLGRTVQWFDGSKGKKGTLGTRVGWVFAREKLSAGKLGGQGKVRKCLTFDTHSPHKHTCPRERRKILTSRTALEPSKFRSEWLLPGPESATSTPGNKYCEMGNGGGLPNKRWGTGKTYRELKIMETEMSRDGKYGC